jgi:hypothetical protein
MSAPTTTRACRVCGASLAGLRSDAETCFPAGRRERSRVRRLAAGKPEHGYADLGAYRSRKRRTAIRLGGAAGSFCAPTRPVEACCEHPVPVQRGSELCRCESCGAEIPAAFEVPA